MPSHIPLLQNANIKCNVPLEGKGIGEQLRFYKEYLEIVSVTSILTVEKNR
jgi:hypothetical protein